MIAVVGFVSLIGVFVAGAVFEAHTVTALFIVSLCALALGVLFAAVEQHAREGERMKPGSIYTWSMLWLSAIRWATNKGLMLGEQPLYVQTLTGVVPAQGVFFGRMNGALSVFIDTVPEDTTTVDMRFNQLKQGVM